MKELTELYIRLFNEKKIDEVARLFHPDSILTDPLNSFNNINEIRNEIDKIFNSCENLSFSAKNIFYDEDQQTSVIEFILDLDDIHLEGIDVIQWKDNKIKELRAYLNLE
jgi:hypothetical protein